MSGRRSVHRCDLNQSDIVRDLRALGAKVLTRDNLLEIIQELEDLNNEIDDLNNIIDRGPTGIVGDPQ